MVRVGEVRDPDPATHAIYDELYRDVYRRMYPRLRPLYREHPPDHRLPVGLSPELGLRVSPRPWSP